MGIFSRNKTVAEPVLTRSHVVLADGAEPSAVGKGYTSFVREGYGGNGPVFSLVAFKAAALSQTRIAWVDANGDVTDDALPEVLRRPWPGGTTSALLKRMSIDASLAGTAFVRLSGNRLYRLRPDWVDFHIVEHGDGSWSLDGYLFWPKGRGSDREFIPLLPDEVAAWSPNPDPEHHLRGVSWLRPVATEADADNLMTHHKRKFFTNAATPNLAIKTEQELSDAQRELLQKQFEARYTGTDNAYKTILLEGGADLSVVGRDFEQMAFTNVQAAGETRLASAANVPPIAVGFVQGIQSSTYSNYGQAMRRFNDLSWHPEADEAVSALATLFDQPDGRTLAVDSRRVPFLQQDAQDEAAIVKEQALTIESYIRAGYTAVSAVAAVVSGDPSKLVHTGLFSVQLQPPGTEMDNTVTDQGDGTDVGQ